MSAFKQKDRLVTFRLTEYEYESVKNLCSHKSLRSISEFVRIAVLKEVSREGWGNSSFADDLETLTLRLQDVDAAAKEMSRRIAKLLGSERAAESLRS